MSCFVICKRNPTLQTIETLLQKLIKHQWIVLFATILKNSPVSLKLFKLYITISMSTQFAFELVFHAMYLCDHINDIQAVYSLNIKWHSMNGMIYSRMHLFLRPLPLLFLIFFVSDVVDFLLFLLFLVLVLLVLVFLVLVLFSFFFFLSLLLDLAPLLLSLLLLLLLLLFFFVVVLLLPPHPLLTLSGLLSSSLFLNCII